MARSSTSVPDGFTSLDGGMDGGSATNLLPRNKYAFGMNATARTGYLNNRPGWKNLPMTFANDDVAAFYAVGIFQGAEWYKPDVGEPTLFISVSGNIFVGQWTGKSFSMENLTPSGDANKSDLPEAWFCQADKFMVIQDGLDAPFIYDGVTLRRSNIAAGEVPTGTRMAYGYGRLFLAKGKNIAAGDILDATIPNSPINFLEIRQYQDAFAVPLTSGNITALIFGTNLNTNLGQGPLQAHTESGQVITLNITVDRKSWTTVPIQLIAMQGGASTGQSAVVNVNGDTWFRALDGYRSFIVALRDFTSWGNTPQSRELNQILAYDTVEYLKYVSGVVFDNRLMFTLSPQVQGNNIVFQGLGVLDFDLLGALGSSIANAQGGSSSSPAYDGVWSGLNITHINKAYFGYQERCFIFTNDPADGNQIWELSKADPFDNGNCPIPSFIETGSYTFGSLVNRKKLDVGDLWIDQLQGHVDFDIKWAPEQYPFWYDWQDFSQADGGVCSVINPVTHCQTPVNVPVQYRSRIRLQQPEAPANGPETDYPPDVGYDFRFRIAFTGRCRIKGFRVQSYLLPEESTGAAPINE